MKKRLISFLLAVSMMLSILPVGAVAQSAVPSTRASAVTTIPVSGGKPTANSGTGWTYDSSRRMLTLKSGTFQISGSLSNVNCTINSGATLLSTSGSFNYECFVDNYGTIGQSGNSSTPSLSCSVTNRSTGIIAGGAFSYDVTNLGRITGGIFKSNSCKIYNEAGGRIEWTNGTSSSGLPSFSCLAVYNKGGTIKGGKFNTTVRNSSTITGGSFTALISSTAVTKVDSVDFLIASAKPSSGTFYTITRKEGESFSVTNINDKILDSADYTKTLYIQTNSTNTVKLKTNKEIKSINGENFSGCVSSGSSYISTIDLNNYEAGATLTLSTSLEPTAELEIRADTGGKPDTNAEGVIATPNADGTTTYNGKGWEYKPDPDNNNTMTLYITDASITLNSNRVKVNAVRVPIVTKGDIEAGSYTMPVTCRNISGNSFDANVTCNGNISGGVFNKDCTVTISSGHTVTGGTFKGKVINSGVIGQYNIKPGFSGTVINKGTIQNGIFNGPVESSGNIHDGTFRDTVTNTGTIYYKGTFNGAVINKSLILGGTYSNTVTLEGQHGIIRAGLFKQPVTVNGSAEISGGLFINDVTLAEGALLNIAGGVFTNDVTGSLKSVTIKNGDTFTANGYTQYQLSKVYIANDSSLNLSAVKALGFINGKKIEPSWNLLSSQDKTVKLNINDLVNNHRIPSADNIVLGYALTAPTSDLFTVSGLPQGLTYGDNDISTQLSAIAPAKADEAAKVGNPAVAGFYKLNDDGNLPASPVLLTAAEVKDAGTYAVVLKVDTETDTYSTASALYNLTNWTFTIGKKTITAADFTFSPPALDSLTYDGTAKKATVQPADADNPVATSFTVKHTDAAGTVVTAPFNAGIYKVVLDITPDSNHKLEGTSTLGSDAWTFRIAKADLTADMFERTTDTNGDPTMTLKTAYKNCGVGTYTVCSELVPISTYSMPVNAGTYQFYINAAEGDNYNGNPHLTNDEESWCFVVDQREPTADLFTIPTQDVTYDGNPHAAAVRAKTAAELTDVPTGPITADFTVKYRLAGEGSAFTTTEPTNAGTYEVAVSFPAAGNYKGAEDLFLGQFTIDKKAITAEDFTFSTPANLIYDGNAKTATVTQTTEVADNITVKYTDAAGTAVTAPTNAGTYKVVLDITPDRNHKLEGTSTLGSDDWTFEIAKATLTANDFEMVGEGENRTIQPKDGHDGVTVGEVKWMPVESTATLSLDLDEMDSGTYQAYITVSAAANSNYKAPDEQLTSEDWTFSIGKRDLTAADFTIKKPEYPDDRFDGDPKNVQPTYKGAVAIGEITVTYWKQNDAGEWVAIEGAPVETGTYRFTLDVAESPNNNPATGLRGDDWQFTIAEPLYHVYVEGGRAYYFDATDTRKDIDDETLVPAKVTVHLVADTDETADTEIALLTLDAEDEGTVDDFQWYIDPRTGSNLTEIANPTSRTDASFVMPRGDVYITTTNPNPNPEPEIVDSGAGTAVAVVLGGAAIGGVAYLAGTQLYLESVLPKGAAIPVNRQQLADLLWTTAGKPQPQNSVLFTDISAEAIDSQKAARWCVEQGLMQADGTSFKPSRHTFRPQVIKAWNDLQAMQKAG